ncbi:mRNA turnover protein 4 homolog [Oscarella lobularis]|uniref:mRNA turnover protein 4 homolog n=1 Tax=Oscarella lobularis TaxID=121494 RepID=UPI0033133B4C
MPKSKRAKLISLTRTKKKGVERKKTLLDEVRDSVDNYASIFVFSVENMRNSKLKDVRTQWKDSRFFFGKNKVMAVALGKTPEEERKENLHQLSERLKGNVGLLFTNQDKHHVIDWFKKFKEPDYARAGTAASFDVILDAGPLDDFPHSMEPQLRQLGLPVALKKGVVTLTEDYRICSEGDELSPDQAKLLKLFGRPMIEFHVKLESVWSGGTMTDLSAADK